jgi:hypothetical protein
MEENFIYALLGSICLIEFFAIGYLLCSVSYLKVANTELKSRALNAESDLLEARIKIVIQDDQIAGLEEMKRLQLKNSIELEKENTNLSHSFPNYKPNTQRRTRNALKGNLQHERE